MVSRNRMGALRAGVFYLGMIVITVIFGVVMPLFLPFGFPIRYGALTQWSRLVLGWLKLSCGIDWRVEGRENIPAETTVVLAKHQSTWETLAMQWVFPPQTWVLKRELLRIPIFGWGLKMLKSIAIDRNAGRRALETVIAEGKMLLDDGIWVIVFPEGTRTPPGERGRYSVGGAKLAVESGYPVVPVAHNAGEHWPRRGFAKHPGTITLVVGPAIPTRGRKASEVGREAEAWIEETMTRITGRD